MSARIMTHKSGDEQPEERALVGCAFNRLDPSRRSISTPSVELMAIRAAANRAATTSQQQTPNKLATDQHKLTQSNSNSNKSNIWRRRTALGLIPLGPLNWLTGNQQQQQQQQQDPNSRHSELPVKGSRKFSSLIRQKQATIGASKQTVLTMAETETTCCINESDLDQLGQSANSDIISEEVGRADPQRDSSVKFSDQHSTSEGLVEPEVANPSNMANIPHKEPPKPSGASKQQTATNDKQVTSQQLIERLIDSELEWRQLISDANGGPNALSQLSETQIKRQEVIHELILTERHHCLTLALMRQVYFAGLRKLNETRASSAASQPAIGSQAEPQLQGEQIDLERLFPALDDLIQAHELFFAHLRLRLVECCGQRKDSLANSPAAPSELVGLVGPLGDLLISQFRLCEPPTPEQQAPNVDLGPRSKGAAIATSAHYANLYQSDKQRGYRLETSSKQQAPTGNGHKLLAAYGKFCGQQHDSTRYYKYLMQHDRGFKLFIESKVQRLSNSTELTGTMQQQQQQQTTTTGDSSIRSHWRQRGITECNLLVAQRLTKYPLLIEQLIKCSKDDPSEEEKLRQALSECRKLLSELNTQLARKESFERLLDIYAQFSPKSYTIYNRKLKFTKHNLLQNKRIRQLLHLDDQVRLWSATRRKLFQVTCLILNDLVVFLRVEHPTSGQSSHSASLANPMPLPMSSSSIHNSGQLHHSYDFEPSYGNLRYYFANIDNKSSVISLSKLLVREKAQINDSNEPRVYLISSSPRQPEMYELAFQSKRHQSTFVQKLKNCIETRQRERQQRQQRNCGDYSDASPRRSRDLGLSASSSSEVELDDDDDDDDEDDDYSELDDHEHLRRVRARHEPARNDDDEAQLCAEAGSSTPPSTIERLTQMSLCDSKHCREVLAASNLTARRRPTDRRLRHVQHASQVNRRVTIPSCDQSAEPFDFDIEQDILLDPRDTLDELGNGSLPTTRHHTLTAGLMSSCPTEEASQIANSNRRQSDTTTTTTTTSNQQQQQQPVTNDGAPNDANDVELSDRECLASNESGLSELARDSMDESTGSLRPRVRANHRRRRLQRPRQVSNQSSSSSEPSHRQAINQVIDGVVEAKHSLAAGEPEENDDSGRGLDLESSASSSVDSSSRPKLTGSTSIGDGLCQIIANNNCNNPKQADYSNSFVLSKSNGSLTSICKHSMSNRENQLLLASLRQRYGPETQKPPKERKLSTVSNLSSQVKLFHRVRSSAHSTRDAYQQPQLPAALCVHCSNRLAASLVAGNSSRPNRRGSLFVPEQKLEELRDIQIQLEKDKREWQSKFEMMQEHLMNERRDLDLARDRLKLDRQQVADEREKLYRKLDILKEKGILLSPSHKVHIITNAVTNPSISPAIVSDYPMHLTGSLIHQQAINGDTQPSYFRMSQPSPSLSTSIKINGQNNSSHVTIDHESTMRRQQQQQNQIQFQLQLQKQAHIIPQQSASCNAPQLKAPMYLCESTNQQPTNAQSKISHCLGLTSKIPLLSALSGSLLSSTSK